MLTRYLFRLPWFDRQRGWKRSASSGNKLQVSIADQTARFPLREPESRQFRAQLLLRQRLIVVVRAPSLIGRGLVADLCVRLAIFIGPPQRASGPNILEQRGTPTGWLAARIQRELSLQLRGDGDCYELRVASESAEAGFVSAHLIGHDEVVVEARLQATRKVVPDNCSNSWSTSAGEGEP